VDPGEGGVDPVERLGQRSAGAIVVGQGEQLIELRLARLTNLADLYAALGGGWRD
jgi:hypothetical protein